MPKRQAGFSILKFFNSADVGLCEIVIICKVIPDFDAVVLLIQNTAINFVVTSIGRAVLKPYFLLHLQINNQMLAITSKGKIKTANNRRVGSFLLLGTLL